MAHGVVDVVVDVRDPVDDAHDAALERRGLLRPGVRVDPVPNLGGQVQLLGDPQRLLVVAEAEPESLAQRLVERLFARMSERRVAHVMPEPDRLGEILVQAERPRDDPRDAGRLERVRHASPVVVAGGVDEDLRLSLEPPERLRVEDAVAVALEGCPDPALLLGAQAPGGGVRTDRARRQRQLLLPPDALGEGVRNPACEA